MKKKVLRTIMVFGTMIVMSACTGKGSTESSTAAGSPASSPQNVSDNRDAGIKVAAVLALGGLGDGSLSDAINSGLEQAKAELGATVQLVEPKEIAEYKEHFAELARSEEYDLIIGGGFDQSEAIATVAAAFPNQKFLLVDSGIDNDTNVTSISYANNERSFVVGAIAGMMTKNNKVGVIGGADAPFIHNCVAGYIAGAQYANPDVEVSVKYTNSWSDTTLAKEISLAMYDTGVDIIYNQCGGAGLGIYSAAEDNNFYAIGTDTNQNGLSPDHIMCSAISLMGETVFRGIQDEINGMLVPGSELRGFATQGVGYTTDGSNVVIPADVINFADAVIQKIISGELKVPEKLEDVDDFLKSARP